MVEPAPEVSVTYTVRELLDQIKDETIRGNSRIEAKLDAKADRSTLDAFTTQMRSTVERMDERVGRLESWRQGTEARGVGKSEHEAELERKRNWRIAVLGLAATLLIVLATVLPAVVK